MATFPEQQTRGPAGTVGEVRRARREFVRSHHPDRGGNGDSFAAGLGRFDTLLRGLEPHRHAERAVPEPPRPVTVLRRPRGVSGWAKHLGRLVVTAAVCNSRKPSRVS